MGAECESMSGFFRNSLPLNMLQKWAAIPMEVLQRIFLYAIKRTLMSYAPHIHYSKGLPLEVHEGTHHPMHRGIVGLESPDVQSRITALSLVLERLHGVVGDFWEDKVVVSFHFQPLNQQTSLPWLLSISLLEDKSLLDCWMSVKLTLDRVTIFGNDNLTTHQGLIPSLHTLSVHYPNPTTAFLFAGYRAAHVQHSTLSFPPTWDDFAWKSHNLNPADYDVNPLVLLDAGGSMDIPNSNLSADSALGCDLMNKVQLDMDYREVPQHNNKAMGPAKSQTHLKELVLLDPHQDSDRDSRKLLLQNEQGAAIEDHHGRLLAIHLSNVFETIHDDIVDAGHELSHNYKFSKTS
ncbi:uncharacterized protein EI90DRAFT_3022687 [Cantharellus anzutake]|uniref:uncharacterized protein n=1 Tax=Cantharellus anzutake TaxID=1750568 RepID=UPI001906F19F|nr:uncharacterized protein EI90DRAFT_3022687 [Cantharellus anzutake]KAF8313323.1 hypothetical protein EI90DRAFT_3022687 [Cantharellus anzutake]